MAKRRTPADLRVRARTAVFQHPVIGRTLVILDRQTRSIRPTRRTELVIDGYPRSANSFATVVFIQSNPTAVVSHHLHSPVTFRVAARLGTPMVLLIRNPRDAVASYLQFAGGVTARSAVRMYVRYYAAALPYLAEVVIADFDEVVSDFGAVLRACNAKYGTSFHAPTAGTGFYEEIDSQMRGFAQDYRQVPLPHANRLSSDDVLRDAGHDVLKELATAESLYLEIRAYAVTRDGVIGEPPHPLPQRN